jgi:hypothetical protein
MSISRCRSCWKYSFQSLCRCCISLRWATLTALFSFFCDPASILTRYCCSRERVRTMLSCRAYACRSLPSRMQFSFLAYSMFLSSADSTVVRRGSGRRCEGGEGRARRGMGWTCGTALVCRVFSCWWWGCAYPLRITCSCSVSRTPRNCSPAAPSQ